MRQLDLFDAGTLADIEGDQAAIYQLAGADAEDALNPAELSRRLLRTSPDFAPLRTESTLAWVGGMPRIYVREGTSATRARWLIGHEIAEWYYEREGYHGADLEARCNALGASLVVPRAVLRRARKLVGDDPVELAKKLKTTQSLALLRLGEVTGEPVAVIRRWGTIVRGEPFVWPRLSYTRAKNEKWRKLRRVDIEDEPARVGLVVA